MNKYLHGSLWALSFTWLSLMVFFRYLEQPENHYLLLTCTGFLLLIPQLFFNPVYINKPFWEQIKAAQTPEKPWTSWLTLAGIALMLAGIVWRYCS